MTRAAETRQAHLFCERILGNLSARGDAGSRIDPIDIDWRECDQRALRKRTRSGRSISILLPLRSHLHHGDILFEDERSIIAVNIPACDVLVSRPPSAADMGAIALELGNLHIPAQIMADQIITPDDPAAQAAFLNCGLVCDRAQRRFEPTRRLMPLIRFAEDFRIIRR
jgi:urease accessory protein